MWKHPQKPFWVRKPEKKIKIIHLTWRSNTLWREFKFLSFCRVNAGCLGFVRILLKDTIITRAPDFFQNFSLILSYLSGDFALTIAWKDSLWSRDRIYAVLWFKKHSQMSYYKSDMRDTLPIFSNNPFIQCRKSSISGNFFGNLHLDLLRRYE